MIYEERFKTFFLFAILLCGKKVKTMSKSNKMSVWAVIILVATIVSLALLVASVVTTVAALPSAMDAAKQAAIDAGETDQAVIELLVAAAVGAVIAALVFSCVFDVLKIIGGFLFSLKGRWGVFCIVVSIIALVSSVWGLISDITNKMGVTSTIFDVLGLAINTLLVVACFKHYQEVR